MSVAPATLKELRLYLADKTGRDARNFGIRGTCGAKRTAGYHLGKSDIYSDCGLGDRDYSVKRMRDRRGLSEAASAFDIKLPIGELKNLRAFLLAEARAGRARDLVELIGPGDDGRAYDWRKPYWKRIGPRPAGDGHEWHIHLSFHRDSEFRLKVPLFVPYYGPPG